MDYCGAHVSRCNSVDVCVRLVCVCVCVCGAAKLVPLAYGIKKLQISCVVEDDKVSLECSTLQFFIFQTIISLCVYIGWD